MLFTGILHLLLNFVQLIFPVGYDIDASVMDSFTDAMGEVFHIACWLLPMDAVLGIIGITLFLFGLRIVVAIVKTIWGLLPLV